METIIDISNQDLPVANDIRLALAELSPEAKAEVLESMTEPEFVHYRVGLYLEEIERALLSGKYSHSGAEEVARAECMAGLLLHE